MRCIDFGEKMMIETVSIQDLIALIDLTSLNDTDTVESIQALCRQASTVQGGEVAAVCVYPRFVATAKAELVQIAPNVHLATVVNFPEGTDSLETVLTQIHQAVNDGADEIDFVFPYRDFQNGKIIEAEAFTAEAAKQCHQLGVRLKVILETGMLDAKTMRAVADAAIRAGADFLKTSTGKIPQGANLAASAILLEAIRSSGQSVGIKLSGGVRERVAAEAYVRQAAEVFGWEWVTAEHFRLGASSLLGELLSSVNEKVNPCF